MNSQGQYLYVVLTQTGTRISRAVKLFTKAPYNHTSIASDNDLAEMFSFCRYHKRTPLPAGFSREKINAGVFEMFSSVPCEVFAIKVTDEQLEKYNSLITHFIVNKKIYSYNVLGLFAMAFGLRLGRKNTFVCSHFVAHVLTQIGVAQFEKDIALVRPDDFRHLPNAELVYEGDIKKYYTYKHLIRA